MPYRQADVTEGPLRDGTHVEFKGFKIDLFGIAACVSALATLLLALRGRNKKRKGKPDAETDGDNQ
jgi:hypothetical protein